MKDKRNHYKIIIGLLAVIGVLIIALQGNKEERVIVEDTMLENKKEMVVSQENETQESAKEEQESQQEGYEYADFAFADVNSYVNVRNQPSTEGEIVGKI